uniref:Uncharacterized protein n=1 Tax=Craspedostauros australis TaxID=1486917 RepID=A0A7R9WV91_9STRA
MTITSLHFDLNMLARICIILSLLVSTSTQAFITSVPSTASSTASSTAASKFRSNLHKMSASNNKEIYGVPDSGWTSPKWNWGSAMGTGHDCAAISRRNYGTPAKRQGLIDDLLNTREPSDYEEVKLAMALFFQANRRSSLAFQFYGEVLDLMAQAECYEGDDESMNAKLFVGDLQKRYGYIEDVTPEEKIEMNTLFYECEEDWDLARRKCAGLVLTKLEYVELGP